MNGHHSPLSPAVLGRHHENIKNFELPGKNGFDEDVSWVPFQRLKTYWNSRLVDVLRPLSPPRPFKAIREKYLRVFTILVLLDKIEYIDSFTSYGLDDSHWPQTNPDSRWLLTDAFRDFFEGFKNLQWTFFPLEISEDDLIDRVIPSECILPFETVRPVSRDVLTSGSDASTLLVTTPEYSDDTGREPCTFLLKRYNFNGPNGRLQERAYQREHEAYVLTQSTGLSDFVVRFYGSYRQHNTGNLILEYVSGGTLRDYLNKNKDDRPQSRSDIHDFWSSASGLLFALSKVHQVTETSSYPRQGVIHQDIKFDNVVVSMLSPDSRYRFHPKLVDFGLSGVGSVTNDGEKLRAIHNGGNATNSAPEATQHYGASQYGPNTVSSALDIWALGCLFIHLAIWVVEGLEAMEKFDRDRQELHSRHRRFHKTNHDLAFHDGGQILKSVPDYLDKLLTQVHRNGSQDQVTPGIIRVVKEHMINSQPHSRLEANQIANMIENMLSELKPDDTTKKISSSRPRLKLRPATLPALKPLSLRSPLTVNQCVEFRNDSRRRRTPNNEVNTTINLLKKCLDCRDHIFLIDDSQSMKEYSESVLHVFTGLSYLAKQIDGNGIELAFLSSPSTVYRNRGTSQLIDIVKTHQYEHDSLMTENKLNKFVGHVLLPKLPGHLSRRLHSRKKPLTIMVLTDGSWGAGLPGAGGVQEPISVVINTMKSRKIPRTEVMIQFLQFGNDPDGEEYLKYLDEMGRRQGLYVISLEHKIQAQLRYTNSAYSDIVDRRSIDDNVVDMFIGSISESHDMNNAPRHIS